MSVVQCSGSFRTGRNLRLQALILGSNPASFVLLVKGRIIHRQLHSLRRNVLHPRFLIRRRPLREETHLIKAGQRTNHRRNRTHQGHPAHDVQRPFVDFFLFLKLRTAHRHAAHWRSRCRPWRQFHRRLRHRLWHRSRPANLRRLLRQHRTSRTRRWRGQWNRLAPDRRRRRCRTRHPTRSRRRSRRRRTRSRRKWHRRRSRTGRRSHRRTRSRWRRRGRCNRLTLSTRCLRLQGNAHRLLLQRNRRSGNVRTRWGGIRILLVTHREFSGTEISRTIGSFAIGCQHFT